MPKDVMLKTEKTVHQTLSDLHRLFKRMGLDDDNWMPIPADTGPGYKIKFRWKDKWVPIESTVQPTKAANIRMCYRALNFIEEMELRGITGVVSQTIREMGLVSVGGGAGYDSEARLLGISPSASAQEIRKAYRAKAQKFHPDHGGDEDIFKAITEAAAKLLLAQGEKL